MTAIKEMWQLVNNAIMEVQGDAGIAQYNFRLGNGAAKQHCTIDGRSRLYYNSTIDAQMMIFPGGFSFGDEPEGSGKFIAAFMRNPILTQRIHELLYKNDGLILGICNGFQALIKLGLVPYGKIVNTDAASPTLTFNRIGRHQSRGDMGADSFTVPHFPKYTPIRA